MNTKIQKVIDWIKEHPIRFLVNLIVLLVFGFYFLGFLWINYSERHQYDARNEEIAKIIPFSQRGEPLPPTDVPVILPPDPGEEGKKTLAGIDSNNDGVRDDLEREIVYMYPQNEEVRRVLRAMVKKRQDVITTEGDHEHFKALMISAFTFKNCYIYKAFPPNKSDLTNQEILWNMLTNTSKRKKTAKINENKAAPYSSVAGGSVEECEKVKGQY